MVVAMRRFVSVLSEVWEKKLEWSEHPATAECG